MKIQVFEFDGEGMNRVYENEKWLVGIKNWKPSNDITGIDSLERHNQTDELFVLLSGSCVLVYANEENGNLVFKAEKMQPMKVYNIPRSLWHNTITTKDVKLILIEDSSTGMENSDVLNLSKEQIEQVQNLAKI
jgi:ureidoglycolate hydrolase